MQYNYAQHEVISFVAALRCIERREIKQNGKGNWRAAGSQQTATKQRTKQCEQNSAERCDVESAGLQKGEQHCDSYLTYFSAMKAKLRAGTQNIALFLQFTYCGCTLCISQLFFATISLRFILLCEINRTFHKRSSATYGVIVADWTDVCVIMAAFGCCVSTEDIDLQKQLKIRKECTLQS